MLGCGNPLPMQVGGAPSRFERVFGPLQRIVGTNGASGNLETVESAWRQAKALALAALDSSVERAALQFFPRTMTDHLPLAEDYLGLSAVGLNETQRRAAVEAKLTSMGAAWGEAVEEALASIDSTIEVLNPYPAELGSTMGGKWAESAGAPAGTAYDPGGPRTFTAFPNFNEHNLLVVLYPMVNGALLTPAQRRVVERIRETLNALLPSHVDFTIVHRIGFTVGVSIVGNTTL